MLSLDKHFDQAFCMEPAEMCARGGRSHIRYHRQLRAGSRMAVQQAVQNANPRGFADCRCNSGDHQVAMSFCNHTSMINELSMFVK
jgi:hypothetical protein